MCHLELGNLFVSLGKQAAAEAEYRTAVAEYEVPTAGDVAIDLSFIDRLRA